MLEFILAALVVFFLFGFFGLAIGWWTLAAAALLAYLSVNLQLGLTANVVLASVFVVLAAVLNVPWLRRKALTDRILAVYRRILPDMSQTEKEAIDAGTVWWDGDLFSGKPDWDKLLAVPEPRLSRRGAGVPRRPGRGAVRDVRRLGDHARAPGPAAARVAVHQGQGLPRDDHPEAVRRPRLLRARRIPRWCRSSPRARAPRRSR